jgi:hypothetical protein
MSLTKPKPGGGLVKAKPNLLSGRALKEFQCLVSVVAIDVIHAHHSGLSENKQKERMYDLVHGKNDYASQLQMLVEGAQFYKRLYDTVIIDVTKTDATSNTNLVLKKLFNPIQDGKDMVSGKHITVEFIQRAKLNSRVLITGRTLFASAKAGVRNVKKAMAYADAYLDSNKDVPSGTNLKDLVEYVLDTMFSVLSKSDDGEDMPDDDDDEHVEVEEETGAQLGCRPEYWTFKGYTAFMLLACPLATEPRERLAIFTMDGTAEGKQASRKVARKKAKEEQDNDRSFAGAVSGRGLSMESQISLATLQQRQDESGHRAFESGLLRLTLLTQKSQNLVQEQETALKIATQMTDAGLDATKFWSKLDRLETEIEKVKCAVDAKEEEMADAEKTRNVLSRISHDAVTGLLSDPKGSLTPNGRKKQRLNGHPSSVTQSESPSSGSPLTLS